MSDTMINILAAGVWLAVNAGIGFWIGTLGQKGNGPLGGVLGALLGPIGWIITAVLPAEAGGKVEKKAKPARDTAHQQKVDEVARKMGWK